MEPLEHFLIRVKSYISERRLELIEKHALQRSRYCVPVIEDIQQENNSAALLRTVEGIGIQDLYIVENNARFHLAEGITMGAYKWVTPHVFDQGKNNTLSCLRHLKGKGYKIAVASPAEEDYTPEDLPIDTPLAIVFGGEYHGLTETAKSEADYFVKIPMKGFTESFNVSVAAGIILNQLMTRVRAANAPSLIPQKENHELQCTWAIESIANPILQETLLKEFEELRKSN